METSDIPKEVLDFRERWYKKAENFRTRNLTQRDVKIAYDMFHAEKEVLWDFLKERPSGVTSDVAISLADVDSEVFIAFSEGVSNNLKEWTIEPLLNIILSLMMSILVAVVFLGVFHFLDLVIDGGTIWWGTIVVFITLLLAFKQITGEDIKHVTDIMPGSLLGERPKK